MNKKDLPAMYSTAFWCLIVVYCFFWLYCVTTVTPFIERSEGCMVTSICRGPEPVPTRMPFFSPQFKSAANFSALT